MQRPSTRRVPRSLALLGAGALLCPAQAAHAPGRGDASLAGSGLRELELFCARVASNHTKASVGVLPFAVFDQDPRTEDPWVPELSVRLADEVAAAIGERDRRVPVLGTSAMGRRLTQVSIARDELFDDGGIAEHADRLGVDVLVHGRIRRAKDLRVRLRELLTIELLAYDFESGETEHTTFELASDARENAQAWGLLGRESGWARSAAGTRDADPRSFSQELECVIDIVCRRVLEGIDPAALGGAIYVPPADAGSFVRSIARLRAAQQSFFTESERRAEEVDRGVAGVGARPLTLNGVTFAGLAEAEDYINLLWEDLQASDTARFCQSIADRFIEELRPALRPARVVRDLGFTDQSDRQIVGYELATGGLARTRYARARLFDEGIALVVAPRLEQIGGHYHLRVQVYDLAAESVVHSAYMRIDARFSADLAQALGLPADAAPREIEHLEAEERAGWDNVFERVHAGVVRLVGESAAGTVTGTGFVASERGHVITNSHVVAGMRSGSSWVELVDGTRLSFTVVADEPFWDVAIVLVDGLPAGVHVFRFAAPEAARVGVEVAVLGHPRDTQGWALTPGHLSSMRELVPTGGARPRRTFMYTCPTRGGSSGSPVLLLDGSVVAVNSHAFLGAVSGGDGAQLASDGGLLRSELTGFALGAPGEEARAILERVQPNPKRPNR